MDGTRYHPAIRAVDMSSTKRDTLAPEPQDAPLRSISVPHESTIEIPFQKHGSPNDLSHSTTALPIGGLGDGQRRTDCGVDGPGSKSHLQNGRDLKGGPHERPLGTLQLPSSAEEDFDVLADGSTRKLKHDFPSTKNRRPSGMSVGTTSTNRSGQSGGFNYDLKPSGNCELRLQLWWETGDTTKLHVRVHQGKAFVPLPSASLPPPPDSQPQPRPSELSSLSLFSFQEDEEDLDPEVFWVEASWRTGGSQQPDIATRKTCQCICESGKKVTKDGIDGTMYEPVWSEEFLFQVDVNPSGQLAPLQAPSSLQSNLANPESAYQEGGLSNHPSVPPSGQLDDKEQFGNVQHLVLLLFRGSEPVGELTLPLKTMLNAQAQAQWYEMSAVDKTFATRLRRLEGRAGRMSRFYDQGDEDSDMDLRKIMSLRAIFIFIIFFQMSIVILTITVILYQAAIKELTKSAQIISQEVLSSIREQIDNLISALMVGVLTTASVKEEWLTTYNTVAHILLENYNQSVSQKIYVANELYMGVYDGAYIGAGSNNLTQNGPNANEFFVIIPENAGRLGPEQGGLPLNPFEKPVKAAAYNLTAYGILPNCSVGNLSCNIIDYDTVWFTVPDFVLQTRMWFQTAQEASMVTWTKVYEYEPTSDLGITCVQRVPQDPTQPFVFSIAIDLSLQVLSDNLEKLKYYRKGYGFLYEAGTFFLIADSIGAPLKDSQQNRVLINESTYSEISDIGTLLMELKVKGTNGENVSQVYHINKNIVSVGQYKNVGINWIVVVVIPDDDFIDYFNKMLIVSVSVSTTQMVLGIVVAVYVINRIVGQLARCTKQLCYFSALDFSIPVPIHGVHHPIKEIARIYQALRSIRLSLTSFAKYVPPDVVRILVGAGMEAALGGQKKELTIFFSDIVNFTTISETLDLDQLMQLLGEYLEGMSAIVQDNEGTVDKFIGDKVMGLWNAPENVINHPIKACEAALLCHSHLHALKQTWQRLGFPDINMCIGIHTGPAIVGNFGSKDRLNYTALGDSVNLASRLEGLNKEYGTQITISEDTFNFVKGNFVCRPLDTVAVKGKAKPILVYELIAHLEAATPEQYEAAKLFSEAYTKYQVKDFAGAAVLFDRYLTIYKPDDIAASRHVKDCKQLLQDPDSNLWTGVRRMSHK